jgi:hypothetical protein
MKDIRVTLPIVKQQGMPVHVRFGLDHFAWETARGMIYYTFNKWLLASTCLLAFSLLYIIRNKPEEITRVYNLVQKNGHFTDESGNVHNIEFPYETFAEVEKLEGKILSTKKEPTKVRSAFMEEKHKLIYRYKTTFEVNRTEQLPIEALLRLNKEISTLYLEKVLPACSEDQEIIDFFSDNENIYKIETALMEQAKYHIPASIKLASAALATEFGKKIHHNNYFNTREEKQKNTEIVVTEYLTQEQVIKYKEFIISHEPTKFKNPALFACKIKQSFKEYYSPWASFRDHSLYLTKTRRFAPLFTLGNTFKKWAEKLGNPVTGGLGYSTEPDFGEKLIDLIEKYQLDLLDH